MQREVSAGVTVGVNADAQSTFDPIFKALAQIKGGITVANHWDITGRGFDSLEAFIGIGESRPEVSYEEAAKGLNVGVGTVKTLIHRLRRHYLAAVREEVARTVSNPAEIDEEIHALCDALIAAEGRVMP